MPNNNETSLQVNNSNLQALSSKDAEKATKAIQLRIRLLKKELEYLQTMSINIDDRFATFCKQYLKDYGITIFTMRDFRKSFHTYMKNKRTFKVNELQTMLEDYCKENDFIIYPTSNTKNEDYYTKHIYIKGEGDACATIVIKRNTDTANKMLLTLAEEAKNIKEDTNHE